MKVSVIVPAYNEELYIARALTALLAQDYPDFEVIVVDNASTDRTSAVAANFPVKLLHEKQKGTMWACERGRQAASGEVIVRMDADCVPEDAEWLKKGVSYFKDLDVVGVSGVYFFYDHPSVMFRYAVFIGNKLIKIIHNLLIFLKLGACFIGGNTFMRASTLAAIGGFNTSILFWGDDVDTGKRLSKCGKVIFDTALIIKSSGRRYQKEGALRLSLKYVYYFFLVIFKF